MFRVFSVYSLVFERVTYVCSSKPYVTDSYTIHANVLIYGYVYNRLNDVVVQAVISQVVTDWALVPCLSQLRVVSLDIGVIVSISDRVL